ncbi:unnamed protein product [Rhizophagus irregularis]|nr:unnamed protein product [Rhizophagus irregularis]
MYPSQDNIGNSTHITNLTGFINDNYNRLPQATAEIIQAENINCDDPFCNCNNDDTSVVNNNNFPENTTIPLYHNQSISHSTSKNNDIISPGNANYHQQPTFNDVSNNNINISPNNKYQQSISNNTSPPQIHSQYIDQNPLQTNAFPSLNSLGIVINSPQTYIVIMPAPVTSNPNSQQDSSYPNHSIRQ